MTEDKTKVLWGDMEWTGEAKDDMPRFVDTAVDLVHAAHCYDLAGVMLMQHEDGSEDTVPDPTQIASLLAASDQLGGAEEVPRETTAKSCRTAADFLLALADELDS